MDDKRLDRIETKLDQLAEAVVSMARIEERMVTLFRRMDTYDKKQEGLTSRVDALEDESAGRGQMLRFAERVFWIAFTAAVSIGVAALLTGPA